MLGGAVALVLCEAIAGVRAVQSGHETVANRFRNDRGRSDGDARFVASCDGLLGKGQGRDAVLSVDEQKLTGPGQKLHSAAHGQEGGGPDVQRVDLQGSGHAPCPGPSAVPEGAGEGLSEPGGRRLAPRDLAEPGGLQPRGKDDGGSHPRAGQRASPHLIDTGNQAVALSDKGSFAVKAGYQKVPPPS